MQDLQAYTEQPTAVGTNLDQTPDHPFNAVAFTFTLFLFLAVFGGVFAGLCKLVIALGDLISALMRPRPKPAAAQPQLRPMEVYEGADRNGAYTVYVERHPWHAAE